MSVARFRDWPAPLVSLSSSFVVGTILSVFSPTISAQAPVPTGEPIPNGEPTQKVEVLGSVLDSSGAVIPGAQITVTGEQGNITAITDAAGYFRASAAPGQYTVTVSAPGFAKQSKNITVSPNASASVNFVLKGPVPIGEPSHATGKVPGGDPLPADVPMPTGESQTVTASFGNPNELTNWLNAQSARGLRIQAILAIDKFENLFVWVSHSGKDQLNAVPLSSANSPAKLQKVLTGYAEPTVVGSAWVNQIQYVVLRTNNP